MAKIDDVINSLSSEELDLLHSDPKLLSEFKTKYTTQATPAKEEAPKFYEIEKQQGLPKSPMDLVKQVGNQFKEGLTSPMPGSLLSVPIKAMSETASQAGADVARGTEHALGTGLARGAGFVTAAALDPLSYFGGGLLKGPKPAKALEQAAMKPGVEDMLNNLKEQNAPLKAVIEEQTQKVMDQVDNVVKKYGGELNDAKKALKIPVTNAEREAAIVEHGNPHGLSDKNINAMYKEMVAPPKNATDLVKNIAKFKAVESGIEDEAMRVKLASALQDNINSMVDWTKSGNTTEGVLKSQYKDLQRIGVPQSLKASKGKMAEVLDLTNTLSSKLDEPGKAEAYLRNIVTGKSARNKDSLMAIRHLEELSGEKIFDKIATAVKTEKATEAAIKQFEKFKPTEQKALKDSGVSIQDILSHKITGWTSVINDIIKFKDQIKTAGKKAPAAMGRQGLIGASRGFSLSDSNKKQLDEAMSRIKNAK